MCVSLAAHVPSMYCLLSFAQNDGSWLIRQLCPRVGKFSLYPGGEARGLASLTRDGPQKAPRSRVVRIRVNSNQCAKIVLSQEFLVYSPSSALFLAFLGQLAGITPVTASVCILLRPNRNILCGYTNSEYIPERGASAKLSLSYHMRSEKYFDKESSHRPPDFGASLVECVPLCNWEVCVACVSFPPFS